MELGEWVADHIFAPIFNAIYAVRDVFRKYASEGIDLVWTLVKDIPMPWRISVQALLMPFALTYSLLKPAIEGVWAIMPGPLKTLVNFIKAMSLEMWMTISRFLEDPVGTLKAGWDFLAGKVGELGSTVSAAFNAAYDWLKTNVADPIANGISQIGGWVADALKGVAEAVGSGLHALVDWLLKHLTWFGEMVVGAVNSVVAAIKGFITDLARRFIDTLTASFSPHSPDPQVENTMKVMVETMHRRVVDEIKKMYKSPPSTSEVLATAGSVATLLGVGILSVKALAAAADAAHPTKDIGFKDIATSMIAGTGAAMAMSSIIRMPVDVGLLTPLRHAYNETFKPAIPHIEEAQRMFWRGVITEEQFMSVVYKSGFGDPWAKGFLELTKVIPGVRDLITFVVREVITPEDFYSWSAKQGLSEYWAKAYWDSHWVLPSFGDLREAFWRGIITESEYRKYVVWHDYSPSPRPGISKSDQDIMAELSYELPGRIDSRWMFRWGEVDFDTLKELFEKQGLHPDWVERVARATAKNQWLTEINRLRDNAKRKFVDGLIDEETLRADLEALGYPPTWVDYHVQDAIQDREAEHTKALIDIYLDSYYKDLITYEVLEDNLRSVIVDPVTLSLTLEKAYIRKNPGMKAGEARA
ncbi:MAG: hypothetical protein JRE40_01485 [Deltaproteobacteria bacterium]|nr:hypothetical protein [Deltaproteobacteria bacterium]